MTAVAEGPRTYGNWIRRQSPGLLGLGTFGTVLLLGGAAFAMAVETALGLLAGLAVLLLLIAMLVPMAVKDSTGRSLWSHACRRAAWRLGVARGQHVYLTGLRAVELMGRAQPLPGLLAGSELYEFELSDGTRLGMVRVPKANYYTIWLQATPDGSALVDQSTIDTWVALHGRSLAALCLEPAVVGAADVIETSPDPGNRLARDVARQLVPGAPALARAMLEESARTFPKATPRVDAWRAVSFSAIRGGLQRNEFITADERSSLSRVRTPAEMAALIASRLPGLLSALAQSGAGSASPMSAEQITRTVWAAHNPARAEAMDAAVNEGAETGLTWNTAGPEAHFEAATSYLHGKGAGGAIGSASAVFQMDEAPRSAVESSVLASILAPHPDIDVKRVAVLYRPYPSRTGAAIVDQAVRTAVSNSSTTSTRGQAANQMEQKKATQTAMEEAGGAGVTDYSIIVTATVLDPVRLGQAIETTDQLGRGLLLKPAWGAQASTFAAGLGLLVPERHQRIPSKLADYL